MPGLFRSLLIITLFVHSNVVAAEWAEYQSDNFVVYSDIREREARRLMEEFEIFRQVALTMLNLPNTPETERLKIFVFDRMQDFNRISSSATAIGFFYHSVFGPRMIVGPQASDRTRSTLYHEYVHHLMNSRFSVNYPTWYNEGIAELLDTMRIESSQIIVGTPPEWGGTWNPAPVEDVVTRRHDQIYSDFYQTSWLMVHHFLIESYEDPTRAQQTADYIRRYDAGEDPVEAFVDSYGVSPREMHDEMNMNQLNRRFTAITLPRFEYEGGLARRALGPDEQLYILADIAVELDQYDAAYRYFDDFEELELDSPLALKAKSRKSIAHIHEERVADGDALTDEILASNPADPDVLADVAHYAFDRYNYARDNAEDGSYSHLVRSLEFGQRAVEGNPGDLEALYYLGLAYELDGNLQQAVDTLLRSYDINPSVPRLNQNLARVLVKGRQIELASYLLDRVYSSTHSEEARTRIREIQRLIEAEDFAIESIEDLL